MSLSTVMLLAAALVAAPAPPTKEDVAKKDLEKLQGDWALSQMEENGEVQEVAGKDEDRPIFRLKDNVWSLRLGRNNTFQEGGKIELHPTRKPRAMDATFETGANTEHAKAIYELDGDTLRIAYLRHERGDGSADFEAERPKGFKMEPVESKRMPHLRVMTLKRVKP